jgi:hypothetical protein
MRAIGRVPEEIVRLTDGLAKILDVDGAPYTSIISAMEIFQRSTIDKLSRNITHAAEDEASVRSKRRPR